MFVGRDAVDLGDGIGVIVGGMVTTRSRVGTAVGVGEVLEVCKSEMINSILSHPSQTPTPSAASKMRTHKHPRPPLGRRGERVAGPNVGGTEPCCLTL